MPQPGVLGLRRIVFRCLIFAIVRSFIISQVLIFFCRGLRFFCPLCKFCHVQQPLYHFVRSAFGVFRRDQQSPRRRAEIPGIGCAIFANPLDEGFVAGCLARWLNLLVVVISDYLFKGLWYHRIVAYRGERGNYNRVDILSGNYIPDDPKVCLAKQTYWKLP